MAVLVAVAVVIRWVLRAEQGTPRLLVPHKAQMVAQAAQAAAVITAAAVAVHLLLVE